jgi:hypothetical protein
LSGRPPLVIIRQVEVPTLVQPAHRLPDKDYAVPRRGRGELSLCVSNRHIESLA